MKNLFKDIAQFLAEDMSLDLMGMARLDSDDIGIDGVYIWVGLDPKAHAMRVKISNEKNSWSDDNFTISLPDLHIRTGKPARWVPVDDIMDFLRLNMDEFQSFGRGEYFSSRKFTSSLHKLSEGSLKESPYTAWCNRMKKAGAQTFKPAYNINIDGASSDVEYAIGNGKRIGAFSKSQGHEINLKEHVYT